MDTSAQVNHPRTLAAVRLVLSVVAVGAVLSLGVVGLAILGLTLVLAGVSLAVTGDANLLGFATLALVGFLGIGSLSALVVVGTRRVDRRVRMADRRPDPVETVTRAYVVGDIDERTLERRLERVLADSSPARPTRRARLRTLFVACCGLPGRLVSRRRSPVRAADQSLGSARSRPAPTRFPSSPPPPSRSRTREHEKHL